MTSQQVAEYFNCSPNSVNRWSNSGALRAFRLGNRDLRFRQEDVDEFLVGVNRQDRSNDRDLGYGRGSNMEFDYEGAKMRSSGPVAKTPKGYVVVTDRQLECLSASAIRHSHSEAAYFLGISEHSLKNQLSHLYARLQVGSMSEALAMVGWLKVPKEWAPKVEAP